MDAAMITELIEQKQFKTYLPFLKLARDNLATSPLVSYWSLFYIVDKGLKSQTDSKSVDRNFNRFLGTLMTALEKEKNTRKGDQLFDNEQESRQFIENYANKLLVNAQNETEHGTSLNLAIKKFLAASTAFQLLTLFGGDISESIAKRIKYCKWKAVTIAKDAKQAAIDHSDSENQLSDASVHQQLSTKDDSDIISSHSNDSSQDTSNNNKPEVHSKLDPLGDIDLTQLLNNMTLSDPDTTKAVLFCKSALKAICNQHVVTAIAYLKQAIQTLEKSNRI